MNLDRYQSENLNELISVIDSSEIKVLILGGIPGSGKSTLRNQLNDYFIICKDDIRVFFSQQEFNEIITTDKLEKYNPLMKVIIPTLIECFFNYQLIQSLHITDMKLLELIIKTSSKSNLSKVPKKLLNSVYTYIMSRLNDIEGKKGICFDACHFMTSQRKEILKMINKRCKNYIIYLNTTIEQAKESNLKRSQIIDNNDGKFVPDEVIDKMKELEKLPSLKEGFNKVFLLERKI